MCVYLQTSKPLLPSAGLAWSSYYSKGNMREMSLCCCHLMDSNPQSIWLGHSGSSAGPRGCLPSPPVGWLNGLIEYILFPFPCFVWRLQCQDFFPDVPYFLFPHTAHESSSGSGIVRIRVISVGSHIHLLLSFLIVLWKQLIFSKSMPESKGKISTTYPRKAPGGRSVLNGLFYSAREAHPSLAPLCLGRHWHTHIPFPNR